MSENTTPAVPTPKGQMRTRDRDELAQVLAGHEMVVTYDGQLAGCVSCRACRAMGEWTGVDTLSAVREHDAHVLLASDWLAQRDRRVAVRALRAMAEKFRSDAKATWGGDVGWSTTGAKVAGLAASWCNQEADEIEAGE